VYALRPGSGPDAALLTYNLRQPDKIGPDLTRMATEDIATVAAEAYEVVDAPEPPRDPTEPPRGCTIS
jgi:hypothetical protein